MKKIAVIGGGASGLAAAIAAARSNPKVQITIYEQKDSVGKKILATGNGRCNLTNKDMKSSYYRSENIPFVEEVLEQFGYEDTIRFFSSLGLMVKERGNYVYPHSDQASTVLELLKLELHRLGIKILTGVQVTDITPISSGFMIKLNTGKQKTDAVILACGGKASSKLGSDGSGYTLAKGLGHTMVPVVPALVQLKVRKNPFAKAAGVRTDASVTAICDGKPLLLTAENYSLQRMEFPEFLYFKSAAMLRKLYISSKMQRLKLTFCLRCQKTNFYPFF